MDGLGDLFDFAENIMTGMPHSDVDDEVEHEDRSTSVEDQRDGSWENEE
jgi:nucleolar MIF4G domain-containing protein 1